MSGPRQHSGNSAGGDATVVLMIYKLSLTKHAAVCTSLSNVKRKVLQQLKE